MIDPIKNNLRRFGMDLVKYDARRSPAKCLILLLERLKTETVLDIGANTGQYGEELRGAGFEGDIVSFEPLSAAHAKLGERAKNDPKWKVMERCAIGAEGGEATINVSGNSVSSSILGISDAHIAAAPGSDYVGTEVVPVQTLNDLLPGLLDSGSGAHLKIDTQGYERFVVQGGSEVLDQVSSIEMELSLSPMYEGGWLSHEAFAEMAELGFRPFTVFPFFQDHSTGETFQMDALFVRADEA